MAWLFRELLPTCFHSTIRLVLALTAVPGYYSLDLNAASVFNSSDLSPGERIYKKGPAGYSIGEINCLCLLTCIYSLVQAPCQ